MLIYVQVEKGPKHSDRAFSDYFTAAMIKKVQTILASDTSSDTISNTRSSDIKQFKSVRDRDTMTSFVDNEKCALCKHVYFLRTVRLLRVSMFLVSGISDPAQVDVLGTAANGNHDVEYWAKLCFQSN